MRITSKGQVTIPQEIREKLGLHPNTEVEFSIEGKKAVIKPKAGAPTIGGLTVKRLREGPRMIMSSRELMALLRDEPDEIDTD